MVLDANVADARWQGRSSGEAGLLPPYGREQPGLVPPCDRAVGQPPNVPVVSAFQAPPVTL